MIHPLLWTFSRRVVLEVGWAAALLRGDLPVEQPTKLELVFNLKTGKEPGPGNPSANSLFLADEVIE